MYYPYFRGKLNELLVVRDLSLLLSQSNFCPIIEPVKKSLNGIVRAIDAIEKDGGNAILIINPEYGDYKNQVDEITTFYQTRLEEKECVRVGILLKEKTEIDSIREIVGNHAETPISLIHSGFSDTTQLEKIVENVSDIEHIFLDNKTSSLYRKRFNDKFRVLIRDGFNKTSNKDYPDVEFFSELHITYDDMSLDGFGDFLIVGNDYSESGGPAWAVAIHLTFINTDSDDEMHVYHFKSIRSDTNTDAAGKFAEALEKLVDEVEKPGSMILKTKAVEEFLNLHERGHFPGLGYAKKLSMQHHIETLSTYFSS